MDAPETSNASINKTQRKNSQKSNKQESESHSLQKRPVAKPFQRKSDIYVSNKSNFQAQMNQCRKAIETEDGEIYIHCLGNAIKRGITLALKLVDESNNGLAYEANTSTIDLIDDLHPLIDEEDFSVQKRKNSCLHIRIYRQSNTLTGVNKV